ncbi:hypothetical protein SDC9_89296 [bioreactor metagenome]|uniref:ABC-transporter type IV n=1 Tax=bioreactor metagenome TaxID=1076179 RepID=A0A644ZNV0_9ZZZZ|nr:hypothetical protein [Oscillospiraceae bacterium]
MKAILKYPSIFAVGAAGYSLIELVYRGRTHWSMALTGGICLCGIYAINRLSMLRLSIKAAICAVFITEVEFIVGCLVNIVFKMEVWDYSAQPGNILGQVCPLFCFLWMLLSVGVLTALNIMADKEPSGAAV